MLLFDILCLKHKIHDKLRRGVRLKGSSSFTKAVETQHKDTLTKCHSRVEPGIYLLVSINPNFVFGQDRFAEPSREDYFDFLVRCYFGEGKNLLLLCVQRAYLDLNRTLHGFASHSGAEGLRKQAHQCLATSVIKLKKIESSEQRFDLWHRKTCSEVRESHQQGIRCVRVIHGKGLGSPGKTPVLKDKVHRWLVQKAEVVAFVQAPPMQGGAGALVVLLQPFRAA